MKIQHSQLGAGQWTKMTFMEQMANVGSEVFRAFSWKEKGNHDYAQLAFYRSLELLSFCLGDKKNSARLKEIARSYEVLVDYFAGNNTYGTSRVGLEKYFLDFNRAANLQR